MRKAGPVLAILFFVAAVLAIGAGNGNAFGNILRNRTRANIPVNLTNLPVAAVVRAQVHHIFFAGRGIAVNPEDKLDFKYIRVITGRVLVPPNNISEASSTSPDLEVTCVNITAGRQRCYTLVRAGIIYLDNERYTLRNIDVDDETATASIYKNQTEVGSIAVMKVSKMNTTIWVGTLTIDGATYYAYILGLPHRLQIKERGEERAGNYKACGPKMPEVNATEIANCKKNGGRIYIGRDENGCPMAPVCLNATCPKVEPVSAQVKVTCRNQGGTLVGGVDENGCPVAQRCVLANGETVG